MKSKETRYTKRLYSLETHCIEFEFPLLRRPRSLSVLKEKASKIFPLREVPTIRFGPGYEGKSFAQGDVIELCPQQHNFAVLLHECAHVLGTTREYCHGPAFTRRYFRLLQKHGGVDAEYLTLQYHTRFGHAL